MFLSSPQALKTKVYSYQLSFYENSKINYRAVQTKFINDYEKSISSTYEYMKLDLIKNIKNDTILSTTRTVEMTLEEMAVEGTDGQIIPPPK